MEGTARTGPVAAMVAAATLGLLLLFATPARAHHIVSGPTISGTPQEGQTLTATAQWIGGADMRVAWRWQRCTAGTNQTCTVIKDATTPSHLLTAADVGFVLRVRLTISNSAGASESKRSKPTSVVQPLSASPPPAEETAEPDPELEDPPDDGGESTSFNPPANTVFATDPGGAATLRVMSPFPVVRISGRLTATGAQITRFTVRAPRGSSIAVRCRGSSCPARRFAHAASVRRLRAFERHLRAGTRVSVVVRKPGRIGKWATITIRRGAPPRRVDRCSYPGRGEPAACPAG